MPKKTIRNWNNTNGDVDGIPIFCNKKVKSKTDNPVINPTRVEIVLFIDVYLLVV